MPRTNTKIGFFSLLWILIYPLLSVASPPTEFEKSVVEQNSSISERFDIWAEELDIFLTGKKTVFIPNETTITFANSFSWIEGGQFSYTPQFRLSLDLPNLERKWQLKFSNQDDRENRGINQNRLRTNPNTNSYGAGVGVFNKIGQVDTEFMPLLEYRGEFQMSYVLKFTKNMENDRWKFDPQLELFARPDTGTGEFTRTNLKYKFKPEVSLDLINEQQYSDGDNIFTTNHGFRFNHMYRKNIYGHQALIFEFINREAYHMARYVVSTSIEHQFLRRVLHYSVTPYLAFAKDMDFKGAPGVNFDLLLIF